MRVWLADQVDLIVELFWPLLISGVLAAGVVLFLSYGCLH